MHLILALKREGVWERVFAAVSGDADMAFLFIDSTAVRTHQHAAGAQKKKGNKRWGIRVGG